MQPLLLRRRDARRPRQAGPHGRSPRALLEERRHRPRGHGRRRLRPPRDLGSRRLARATARGRRERRRCCRASCQPKTDHVPVLADEVLSALAPQPGDTVVDCTFGAGGHAALLLGRLRGRRQADRDRPRPDRGAVLRAACAAGRRAKARLLHGEFSAVLGTARRQRRSRRRDPARPRRLLDAARPPRARLLLRRRRAARHAHGPLGAADRARGRQRDRRAGARETSSAATARSATRARSPARSSGAAPAAVRAHERPRRDDQAGDSRRRRASARGIPPSASSRRCGSRSTTSSARSSGRCPPRSRCCVRTAGSR